MPFVGRAPYIDPATDSEVYTPGGVLRPLQGLKQDIATATCVATYRLLVKEWSSYEHPPLEDPSHNGNVLGDKAIGEESKRIVH